MAMSESMLAARRSDRARVTRRRVVASSGAAAAVLVIAACGGDSGQKGTQVAAKPAKIVLRTQTNQYMVDILEQKLLPAYKQRVPQHTVEWERGGLGIEMIQAVMAESAAGTSPDVFWIGSDWVAQMARGKVVKDLSGYIKTWGQDNDYYPNMVETLFGRRWFLPGTGSCDIFLYGMDWLRVA